MPTSYSNELKRAIAENLAKHAGPVEVIARLMTSRGSGTTLAEVPMLWDRHGLTGSVQVMASGTARWVELLADGEMVFGFSQHPEFFVAEAGVVHYYVAFDGPDEDVNVLMIALGCPALIDEPKPELTWRQKPAQF